MCSQSNYYAYGWIYGETLGWMLMIAMMHCAHCVQLCEDQSKVENMLAKKEEQFLLCFVAHTHHNNQTTSIARRASRREEVHMGELKKYFQLNNHTHTHTTEKKILAHLLTCILYVHIVFFSPVRFDSLVKALVVFALSSQFSAFPCFPRLCCFFSLSLFVSLLLLLVCFPFFIIFTDRREERKVNVVFLAGGKYNGILERTYI